MSVSQSFAELSAAKTVLIEKFLRAYDPSWLIEEWRAAELGQRPLSGAGRHFQSYHIKNPIKGLDLALNIARPVFSDDRPTFIRNWEQACAKLGTLVPHEPLLPPFEILRGERNQIAVVMPFCETAVAPADHKTAPLAGLLESLTANLKRAGLILDDYWQLRRCQGHPLVIDLSELKRVEGGGIPLLKR